ncbi:3-hexulose-6-phosphate synthase [Neobacillus piezotolerans]|uniref:3-hexulose-6-phosphate synthase n=1 Tax=Neobacillus piezotolerans TaxID=2259171 RepID=A0A3D8GUX8_9BACI|nr:orotidine 5'-phosphate decarboxylase / HUMPS family protein [Neobacillus piezotolerans]RDU38162.1 3-hexulose-6-phosphate synthase [Neobacillus piezotolerans]
MKLQLAVDRVSIEKAIGIIREAESYIDIIEIGTSLIKDFGLESVRRIRREFPEKAILADIKTVDEAEYEFEAIYQAGADIATVLGASSLETIRICQQVAQKYQKDYMIDLLETSAEKQLELKQFSDGILCVHLPSDKSTGLQALIESTLAQIDDFPRLAVAGGIKPENIAEIKKANFEIAIVGGGITKSADIRETAKIFKSLVG